MFFDVDYVFFIPHKGFNETDTSMSNQIKLNALQIENILDKVVPVIAEPADHEFFRGVIGLKLESCKSSADAALFVRKLLGVA